MKKTSYKAQYKTTSYVYENEEIELLISHPEYKEFIWESMDESIATVQDGIVKGKKNGDVIIRIFPIKNKNDYYDFYVTVLSLEEDEVIKDLVKYHNSNIMVKKDFNVGDAYKTTIIESVNKLLFEPLNINNDFLQLGLLKWDKNPNKEFMKSIEFVTVHYTANFRSGANALAHANYFVNDSHGTSIHYNTGNDGVYHCLEDDKRAAHAGDSLGPIFNWIDTGVEYDGCDLKDVVVDVSKDFYYVINNKKSIIKLPETYNHKDKNCDHLYLEDGTIFNKNTNESKNPKYYFNDMGFKFIVKDNKYYMSTTWWCYSQKPDGRICNVGGNRNSIGIESCVNEGSDLWYTWQITAKLVAYLLKENKLDINRVVGHHFFTAKHCPAQLLENNLELWNKFMELVEAEYLFMTKYNDYQFTIKSLNENELNKNGKLNERNLDNNIRFKIIITANSLLIHYKWIYFLALTVLHLHQYDCNEAPYKDRHQYYLPIHLFLLF